MKKNYIIALSLSMIGFAHAQENEKNIDEIEIHARTKVIKEREEFKRHAQSTEIISNYELNRSNPSFIEQSLGTMAGVQVEKRTLLGGQRIIVRGYGNDQKFNNWGIKMYLNNIPLTGADGVTVLDDVNFGLVNRIEVIKGPAATLYGGGSGGVVRFYIQPENKKGTSVSEQFSTGSFKLFQSSTSVTNVGDNYSITANYGHIGSDGYRPHGKSIKNFYNINGEFKLNQIRNSPYSLHMATHWNRLPARFLMTTIIMALTMETLLISEEEPKQNSSLQESESGISGRLPLILKTILLYFIQGLLVTELLPAPMKRLHFIIMGSDLYSILIKIGISSRARQNLVLKYSNLNLPSPIIATKV